MHPFHKVRLLQVCLQNRGRDNFVQHHKELIALLQRTLRARLRSSRGPKLMFSIASLASNQVQIRSIVRTLETAKTMYNIQAYEVAQPSLEEVFLAAINAHHM